jgi:peptide/nickel transport system permease protein
VTLFALRRLLLAVPTLVGITLVTFLIAHTLPENLVLVNLGDRATKDPAVVAAFKRKWGLDRSLPAQYLTYVSSLARGDLGVSIMSGRPVWQELQLSLPATIELAGTAMLLAVPPGILLGVLAATRPRSALDVITRLASSIGLAVPTFWLAILMLIAFYFQLGWAKGPGRLDAGFTPPPTVTGLYTVDALLAGDLAVFGNAVAHIVLPALVLALVSAAFIVRITRERMIEALSQDYVRTAHAKGLHGRRVIGRHALRNALIPIITVTGTLYAQLMAGTVLTETIFSWPGLGRYAFSSASSLDFPAVLGVALVVGVTYVLVNLAVDILYGLVNPRIRFD